MSRLSPENSRLVPYNSQSRAVVLKHGSTVVLYNEASRTIELDYVEEEDDSVCPTCKRPFDANVYDEDFEGRRGSSTTPSFITPDYFRLLQHSNVGSEQPSRASSPQRRLISPGTPLRGVDESSAFSSSPPEPRATSSHSHKLSVEAFAPNYFKTHFIEERELGRGGAGTVFLVQHVIHGVHVGRFACKRVPVGDDSEWLRKVLLEVQLLQNLSHKNLVKYNHVWLENVKISAFAPEVPCAFILQQYCNHGDLHRYIFKSEEPLTKEEMKSRARRASRGGEMSPVRTRVQRHLPFEEIFSFFRDITSGLHYLHNNGYIHRDLKPENCLLHNTGGHMRVLVSDFGEMQGVNAKRQSTGNTGTISYCAPEVLSRSIDGSLGAFTSKSDIFSLGLIVHLMCFGRLPYSTANVISEEDEDLDALRAEISAWPGLSTDKRDRLDLPERLYSFLGILLAINPEDRPDTEQILQSIKAGSALHDGDTVSPIKERKEARAWPFHRSTSSRSVSTSAEATPAATQMIRRPSALITRHSSDRTILASEDNSPSALSTDSPPVSPSTSNSRTSTTGDTISKDRQYQIPRLLPAPLPRRRGVWSRLVRLAHSHPPQWVRISLLVFKISLTVNLCPHQPMDVKVALLLLVVAAWEGVRNGSDIGTSAAMLILHVMLVVFVKWQDVICQR